MQKSHPFTRRRLCVSALGPRVEQLETRWLLACSALLNDELATLLVACDGRADDVVNITDDGAGTIGVDANGQALGPFAGVSKIVVRTGGGNDTVNYSLENDLVTDRELVIELSSGHDTANLDVCVGDCVGGEGSLSSIESDFSALIEGGSGNDTIAAAFDEFIGAEGSIDALFSADLGRGNDNLNVQLLGDLFDAAVKIAGYGGGGLDTMNLDATQDLINGDGSGIDVVGGASLDVVLEGGNGNDRLDVSHQGRVVSTPPVVPGAPVSAHVAVNPPPPSDAALHIRTNGGSGIDSVTVDVVLDPGTTGDGLRVSASGAGGDDVLELSCVGGEGSVEASLDGGEGRDVGSVTDNVLVTNTEIILPLGPGPGPI